MTSRMTDRDLKGDLRVARDHAVALETKLVESRQTYNARLAVQFQKVIALEIELERIGAEVARLRFEAGRRAEESVVWPHDREGIDG